MPDASAQGEFRPRLLQAHLETSAAAAGGALAVTYWWQNVGTVAADRDWRVFVHIRREGEAEGLAGGVRLGADHEPAVPTHRWGAGRVVTYAAPVPIPPTLPPGEYLLLIGLFEPASGTRQPLELPPDPGGDGCRYLLARFRVTAAAQQSAATPLRCSFFPVPALSAAPGRAPAPARTLTLGGAELALELDAERPCPVAWHVAGSTLGGDPEGETPEVGVLVLAENRVRWVQSMPQALSWTLREADATHAVYHAELRSGDAPSVEFDLAFAVTGDTAEVLLSGVVEHPGYQLVSVRHGRLVSAAGESARLALPNQAGCLIDPARATPCERSFGMDWFNPLLAGVLHDQRAVCVLEVPSVDDRLLATVGEGWAALGAALEHREPATPPVPWLLLAETATVRLRFLAPAGRSPEWMDGARLLRAGVSAQPPSLYAETMIYKIFCDSPGAPSFTTFEQAIELVRRVNQLTDAAPQVVYLVGFQHRGHDTGYPDVFTVNPRLGGRPALLAAMEQAKALNAILSFHDNYDDAYEQSPAWDPALVARDPAGALMLGGVWAGGQSYILSFAADGVAAGRERVRRTLELYPIRDSYHIDVLSAVPRRLDFNPARPASGARSLAGKLAIIDEFNRRGIDVTSEGFCAPFVGHLGHAWHLQRQPSSIFTNSERIPLVPFVFHGHATWGGGRAGPEDIPDALIYGATFSADFSRFTPAAELSDSYYLLTLPWARLRTREMTGYRATGTRRRVDYGPDSFVEVDSQGPHYRVVVGGRLLAEDFTTFAPNARGDAWLAYTRNGGPLEVAAPDGWTAGTRVQAVILTTEGPGAAVPVRLEAGRLHLELPPATPCRLAAR